MESKTSSGRLPMVDSVNFIFPDKTVRTVKGPWQFEAFKPGETKINDDDNGTRYIVTKTDAETLDVHLEKVK